MKEKIKKLIIIWVDNFLYANWTMYILSLVYPIYWVQDIKMVQGGRDIASFNGEKAYFRGTYMQRERMFREYSMI